MTERPLDERSAAVVENIRRIRANIEEARLRSGRTDEVRLMGVTKTVAPELVNLSVENGVTLLGENRVQEFLDKRGDYRGDPVIHFIGGLQTNKVKYIIDKVDMIHSVDSEKLLSEIGRRACAAGLVMDILIEVNIGGEQSKSGVSPEALPELAAMAEETKGVRLRGLMTIPPPDENGSSAGYFERMRRLFDDMKSKNAQIDTLSMGMSDDYQLAVEYGSTIVRIGSMLYGRRNYSFDK